MAAVTLLRPAIALVAVTLLLAGTFSPGLAAAPAHRELDSAERLLRKRFEALPAGSQARIERAPQQLIVRIPVRELFEADSAQLKPQALKALPWSAVTEVLRWHHRLLARVNVYSDNIGGPITNHGLSELRALSLLTALHVASIRPSRVSSAGLGATAALASNDSPEGREQNRRVEVVFGLPGAFAP